MKPMLACPPKGDIRFPVLASPKIDGVRCLIKDGVAVSRSIKPIRNEYVQYVIGCAELNGLDGELVVGDPTDPHCMQNTTSGVMRKDGEPDFTFYVFDDFTDPAAPFHLRLAQAHLRVSRHKMGRVRFLYHTRIEDEPTLLDYETHMTDDGYEGVMLRDPAGPYKHGRSTAKEGYLLKLKRFEDSEAVVIGVVEQMHNANEAKTNALGRTERSTAKDGLVPAGVLGALQVRDLKTGVEFEIGTGFTAEQRKLLWHRWDHPTKGILGCTVTYKHFANGGVKDKPRFPVFKAFRDAEDL